MDWSFSSPYKGTISSLRQTLINIPAEFDIPNDLKAKLESEIPEESKLSATVRRDEASQ